MLERIVREEGLTVLGWRDTPVDVDRHRPHRAGIPTLHRADFHRRRAGHDEDELERKLYVVRKRAEAEIAASDMRDKSSSTSRRCRRAPSSTKACCWRSDCRFLWELTDPEP